VQYAQVELSIEARGRNVRAVSWPSPYILRELFNQLTRTIYIVYNINAIYAKPLADLKIGRQVSQLLVNESTGQALCK
jgi:hypothetical protein